MKRRGKPEDFIDEIRNKQRNIVWPDTVINCRSVEDYLLKGNPKAPPVQRIGALLFGLTFIVVGLVLLTFARGETGGGFWGMVGLSTGVVLLGGLVCWNGLRRK